MEEKVKVIRGPRGQRGKQGAAGVGESSITYSTIDPTISTNPPSKDVLWVNTTSGEQFSCTDNTAGANVWVGSAGSNVPIKNAWAFDGETSYISVPDSDDLKEFSAFTIMSKVLVNGNENSWRQIVTKYRNSSGVGVGYYLGIGSGNLFAGRIVTENGSISTLYSINEAEVSRLPYQVVLRYTGSVLELYVDGFIVNSASHTGTTLDDGMPLTIGASNYDQTEEFNGLITDVAIFNDAVSVALINEHRRGDVFSDTASLVAYYTGVDIIDGVAPRS